MFVKIEICEPMKGAEIATAANTARIFGTNVRVMNLGERLEKRDHHADYHGRQNRRSGGHENRPDRCLDHIECISLIH